MGTKDNYDVGAYVWFKKPSHHSHSLRQSDILDRAVVLAREQRRKIFESLSPKPMDDLFPATSNS